MTWLPVVTVFVSAVYFLHMVCMCNAQTHQNVIFNRLCLLVGAASAGWFAASIGLMYKPDFLNAWCICATLFACSELLRNLYLWAANIKMCEALAEAERTKTLNLR